MPINPFSPLTWWAKCKKQFPNLSFFVHVMKGILDSQIETKRIFNMVGVITSLEHCQTLVLKI
jgi:hypothetical protein